MRPYFKFTLPTLEIHTIEKELWAAASSLEQPLGLLFLKTSRITLRENKVTHTGDVTGVCKKGELVSYNTVW